VGDERQHRDQQPTNQRLEQVDRRIRVLTAGAARPDTVAGWDAEVPGLAWLAARAGYGIQLAPALALLAASVVRGKPVPAALRRAEGVDPAALWPARFPTTRP
jgi:D-arginine dehydrogenase